MATIVRDKRISTNGMIQVTRSSMPDITEYMNEIEDLWDCRWLTNMGAKHRQLEAKLSHYLAVPNITLFTNGHLALESALQALGLTGEVITTPFTFVSTTNAIVRAGLQPIFCDINLQDYTLDVDKIEELINERTTAIVPVHVYGNICDVNVIERIARKYGLRVIYDAAHAFGESVGDVGVGNFGDVSMFSFHATKVFHTIEGGALTYQDSSLKPVLDGLKNFGITSPESVEYIGGNAKMNEFQAAMGICNLRHVDQEIKGRRRVVERYWERLDGVTGIRLTRPQDGVISNYAYLPVLFDGYRCSRDEVHDELHRGGILSRKYFYPLTSSFKCYKLRVNCTKIPVARYVAERVLALPLYSDLALQDVDRICDIILKRR